LGIIATDAPIHAVLKLLEGDIRLMLRRAAASLSEAKGVWRTPG